ncbi:MAG: hypothetical protein QNJ54_01730 [Prochloraceae cyanobacterium]|nr:hypothetical protein [Prochloraceae cyanobacterium]
MTYKSSFNFTPPQSAFEPLAANANATLYFKESVIKVDPITGQEIIGKSSADLIELRAIVHQEDSPRSPSDAYYAGKDQKIIEVRGRLTEPKIFPDTVTHLQEGEIEIDGVRGKFTLKLYPQNPYVKNELGQEFYGIFQP